MQETQIPTWTGVLAATFGICESIFAVPLTRVSDRIGRKRVLLLTLSVQLAGNFALGFCKEVWQAAACLFVIGAANANVAVMRTLVAELVTKEQQARAFAFLPTSAGIGTILGPAIGGALSTIHLSEEHPYVLPNALSAALFLPAMFAAAMLLNNDRQGEYQQVATDDAELQHMDTSIDVDKPEPITRTNRIVLAMNCFIWCNALTGLHAAGFDYTLPVFVQLPHHSQASEGVLRFAQGLGRGPQFTGILLTMAGVVGIISAIILYPVLAKKSSHLHILRLCTMLFPAVYLVFPFTGRVAGSLLGAGACMLLILAKVGLSVAALQSSM